MEAGRTPEEVDTTDVLLIIRVLAYRAGRKDGATKPKAKYLRDILQGG